MAAERRWAVYWLWVGIAILVGYLVFTVVSGLDSAGRWPNAPTGLIQRAVIITGWTWIALVAWHQLRGVSAASGRGSA